MSASIDLTLANLYTALGAFLVSILPTGTEVVQGLGNRVPAPPGPYVAMTAILQPRLATNVVTYDESDPNPTALAHQQSTRVDVQLDCYGPDAGAWAVMVSTLLRDEYACLALAPNCQPLYADDPRQMPFETGEAQYLSRWTLTAALQYNPVTTTAQDFADTLSVTLVDVDVEYPT